MVSVMEILVLSLSIPFTYNIPFLTAFPALCFTIVHRSEAFSVSKSESKCLPSYRNTVSKLSSCSLEAPSPCFCSEWISHVSRCSGFQLSCDIGHVSSSLTSFEDKDLVLVSEVFTHHHWRPKNVPIPSGCGLAFSEHFGSVSSLCASHCADRIL